MARWVALGSVGVVGVAVTVAWGWRALVVYLFFAAISGALAVAALVGGDWVRDSSRGRFDREDRR
jgi:hypothetical protein